MKECCFLVVGTSVWNSYIAADILLTKIIIRPNESSSHSKPARQYYLILLECSR